jgi:hypothetical protein
LHISFDFYWNLILHFFASPLPFFVFLYNWNFIRLWSQIECSFFIHSYIRKINFQTFISYHTTLTTRLPCRYMYTVHACMSFMIKKHERVKKKFSNYQLFLPLALFWYISFIRSIAIPFLHGFTSLISLHLSSFNFESASTITAWKCKQIHTKCKTTWFRLQLLRCDYV